MKCLGWLGLFVMMAVHAALADVGVVLADPTQIGASVWTHAGHTSVYLSNICAETPTKLRFCEPGEQGVILTAYPDFHEATAYEWNAVPVSLYLDGVTDPASAPLYASPALKLAQENAAAHEWLAPVCAGACPEVEHAYWRDVVGATTVRDVYIFAVHTTRQQDEAFIDRGNRLPNRNRYNMVMYNCADFSRDMINLYFPHSVHRDVVNDLGMMGPKSAARSFTRYARKRPELGLYVLHFIQQPGVVARCGTARVGTEVAFHQPKYLIPAALIGDHEVAGSFFVAYFLTARFSLQHTYERFAATPTRAQVDTAALGTQQQWQRYRERFDDVVNDAVADGTLRNKKELRVLFLELDRETIPAIDPQGHAWLVWHAGAAQERRVGVDWSNVQAPGSDVWLARRVLLARIAAELHGPAKGRPPLPVFAQEWALLEQLQRQELTAHDGAPGASSEQPVSTR